MFLSAELIRDVIGNRPAAGSKGRRFTSTDEGIEYYDDGSLWQTITLVASTITNVAAIIQQEAYTAADDTGAANAYAVDLAPVPSLFPYSLIVFKAAHSNTGASTLAVNGGSATPIKKSGTLALASGDILANQIFAVIFDGTNFQLMGALRTLVAGDIPAIPESGVTGLVSDLAARAPTSRLINTTAPLTGGGDLSADRTLAISNFTGDSGSGGAKGAVPAPAAGDAAAAKFLKADGTWGVPAGAGTVTSVALTVPSDLSVSGSPVTGAGTLAVTRNTQSANQVLAGPTSGGAATPAYRALVAADIPAIAESGVTGLVSDLALKAPLASPTFTGTPAAPTPLTADNSTKLATTAYVQAQGYGVISSLPITVGWMMGTGVTGTNVGKRLVAPRAGQFTGAEIVIDASDGAVDLTFDIKKNGTSIFSSARTITHGASAGAVTDLASALTSNPTAVAKGDVFTVDTTSGSASWLFTVAAG